MASTFMKPGVYVEEKNAFPGSAVAVETAVPVFIGYTEKAEWKGKSLKAEPTRIASFAEYVELFGHGFNHKFTVASSVSIDPFKSEFLINPPQIFYLYNCIRLFFQNGGSNCYIMSVGTYGNDNKTEIKKDDFNKEIWVTLEKTIGPTLVVLPDLVSNRSDCYDIYKMVLTHCEVTQNRFAILDVIPDPKDEDDTGTINFFRENIGSEALNYGAAYYPWLNTSIVSAFEINFNNLAIERDALIKLLSSADAADKTLRNDEQDPEKRKEIHEFPDEQFHQYLVAASPVYTQIMDEIRTRLNLLPPAAAMAGIYTSVDNSKGVWKSPTNISLSMVNSPSINISVEEQQRMNIDVIDGKSVNVIRSFPGMGTLVWGARTLDGNSQDWRYINVRRTMIMIEQSLKLACRAYVFEVNDSGTWVTIKSMINNFLGNLWKQGALAGAVPEQTFDVQIGLGTTMTPDDILDGYLIVTVKVALIHPAEFIVITFQQQQQKS